MNWFEIISKSSEKAEIWIYDQIGEDWYTGEGVTSKGFQKELSAIKATEIDLHINSPGGSVFDGSAIYSMLKQHKSIITTYVDGVAASIASLIALAGDKVIMAENALFMIHNPKGYIEVYGEEEDIGKEAEKIKSALKAVKSAMARVYISKTGKMESDVFSLMSDETWMTADVALDYGFIDGIGSEMDLAACAKFVPIMDKVGFRNIPTEIRNYKKDITKLDIEKALRNAGCSRSQAKEIVAVGYRGQDVRNAQTEPTPPLRNAEPAAPVVDEVAFLLTQAELIAPSRA